MNLEILGYRRLDNVSSKTINVDFSSGREGAIPVCHVSLIDDRDAIEHVVEEGLVRSAENIAARTKEDAFADKVELTTEEDQ